MRQRLALILFLALATIYPAPSCRYDTYAQEPFDVVGEYGSDANAGISLLAEGDIGYESLADLIKAKSGDDYYFAADLTPGLGADYEQEYLYDYFLKDIPDDDGYDSWYYYGCLIAYCRPQSASGWSWKRFIFYGELHKINGVWVAKKWLIAFGLPGYTGTNVYGVTYAEGQKFFKQYVACLEKYCALTGEEFNVDGRYDNYINYETHDSDKGGVNNLAEWIRGTSNSNIYDDNPQGGECVCGACCECKCLCGKWSGLTCNGTATDCNCHEETEPEPDCTCSNYCCACKCECEKCAEGEHSAHKNGATTCGGTSEDCAECHEPACTCPNFCCRHKCECEKCADGKHSAHKNDYGTCDGTSENCPDCHDEDDPEETCTCSNYCCACKCECKKCGAAGSCSGVHKNGDSKCDGVATGSTYVCSCHGTTEEETCTCSNYCCACKCECKKCGAAGSCSANHKNGQMKCDGVASGSNYVCSCHGTGEEENEDDEVKLPEDKEYEVPEEEKKDSFVPSTDLNDALSRLKSALSKKFGIEKILALFNSDLLGDLPSWSFTLPAPISITLVLDLNVIADYTFFSIFRAVLSCCVFYQTFMIVFNSLRRLL